MSLPSFDSISNFVSNQLQGLLAFVSSNAAKLSPYLTAFQSKISSIIEVAKPVFQSLLEKAQANKDALVDVVSANVQKLSPEMRIAGLAVTGTVAGLALFVLGRLVVSQMQKGSSFRHSYLTPAEDRQIENGTIQQFFTVLGNASGRALIPRDTARDVLPIFGKVPLMSEGRISTDSFNMHANTISRRGSDIDFIASIAPGLDQVAGSPNPQEFWKMVIWKKVDVIVSLQTSLDKSKVLTTDYVPMKVGDKLLTGTAEEVTLEEVQGNVSKYTLASSVHSNVYRIVCEDWEFDQIFDLSKLENLVEQIKLYNGKKVLVHGVAGIGRTVTLIAAYFLNKEIELGKIRWSNYRQALSDLIIDLRCQRGANAVENEQQLQLLIQYAQQLLTNKQGAQQ